MGVLDVVDRVLAGLLVVTLFERFSMTAHLLDVEVDGGCRAAGGEEPARSIDPDLGQDLVERHELAGALGHRHLDAIAHEAHPRVQVHLHSGWVVAHRPRRVAYSGDRPVVVGAPDVDQMIEPAAELLGHVADVRSEVGRLAVGPIDHPILVVAEVGRAEPHSAVLLVDVASLPESLDGALDPATLVQ